MLVMLVLRSGVAAHRKVILREDQRASFGRTEWADIAIPADRQLAPVHFRVAVDRYGARLRHLADGTATFLNGHPVRETALTDGDSIVAGKTEYGVRIESDPTNGTFTLGRGISAAPALSAADRDPECRVELRRLANGSEFVIGPGDLREPPIAWLDKIAGRRNVYLVANFAYGRLPLPPEWSGADDLLNALPDPVRRGNSLHCIPYTSTLIGSLRALWGRDALITLVSDRPPEPDVQASLGVFCRPSILSKQIHVPYQLARLLSTARAVMVETAELGWELFRSAHDSPSWEELRVSPQRNAS